MTDEEIIKIGQSTCSPFPWGIGSTKNDFLNAVHAVLIAASAEPREKNKPISVLMNEYREDGFNFDDIEGVKRCALRYVQTMPDSQVRTLLYALAIRAETKPSCDPVNHYPIDKILSPAEHWKYTSQNSVMYNFSPAGLVTCVRGILKEFQTQDVEARFIAEHGHRLAQLLGIDSFDIADRDAQIMSMLKENK